MLATRNYDRPLTEREREVVSLVAKGLSNKQIAYELNLAEATIKSHLGVIYVKLKIRNRVGLAMTTLAGEQHV